MFRIEKKIQRITIGNLYAIFFIIISFTKKTLLGSICAINYCHKRALVEHIPYQGSYLVNVFFLSFQ